MSGQLIGNRYRVLRKIGEGGMAVVHLAVDEKLGRDVAIKILKERFENHDEIRSRFQHEARVISAFDHQNILKIFDFSGEDSRQLWIVTELIHGRNVAQILETTPSGWLHPVIAASIAREICSALATAHEQGIIHRDVKPENIMITHQGRVKLMDFGIAKIQRVSSMTQTGMFMGSPSYMSPEQIRGRDIDHRSDIYSVGVLLYEVLTGRLPYTGSSTADIAMRILSGEFTHPKYLMSGLPDELNDCVLNCMKLNTEDRPQSIEQVATVFDDFLNSLGLDRSAQELERCFKDPLAYGDRLAKLLRVTNAKAVSTVIVDELLPPRPPIHANVSRNKPENIAKHLPERRHRQRPTMMPGQQSALTVAQQAQSAMPSSRRSNGDPRHAAHAQSRPDKTQLLSAQAKPRTNAHAARQNHPPRMHDIRSIRRTVPPTPRRNVHQVRHVVHDLSSQRRSSNFFGKFVAAVILLLGGVIVVNNHQDLLGSKTKHPSAQQGRTQKTTTKPPKKDESSVAKSSTKNDPGISPISDSKPTTPANPSPDQREITKNTEKTLLSATSNHAPKKSPTLNADLRPGLKTQSNTKKPMTTANSQPSTPSSTSQKPSTERSPTHLGKSSPETVKINDSDVSSEEPQIDSTAIVQPPSNTPSSTLRPNAANERASKNDATNARGRVSISSTPAAELYINSKRYGTTNDLGTSSEWIELPSGNHRVELRRAGFMTRIETIYLAADARQKFGPYSLQRGDQQPNKMANYRLTLSTTTPPVTVTLTQIETRATQTIVMSQTSQTISLERGIYDVTMNHNGDIRRRRIDLSGTAQQLTFSVDFKQPGASAP